MKQIAIEYPNSPYEEVYAFDWTLHQFIIDLGNTDIEEMEALTKRRLQEALKLHKTLYQLPGRHI